MGILESQPAELQDTIISKTKEMLDLATTIRQQIEAFSRFGNPQIDPKTNQPILNKNNKTKSYIPNFLRAKSQIKISGVYNDDPTLKAAEQQAEKCVEDDQVVMDKHAESIALLEIQCVKRSSRQNTLVSLSPSASA